MSATPLPSYDPVTDVHSKPVVDDTPESISLPHPDRSSGLPLMQVLATRCSTRGFLPEPLPIGLLGGLLWAANGVNRPATGGRTSPSAHTYNEIDIYVALPNGVYRYDVPNHKLVLKHRIDARNMTGYQDFVGKAPLDLVYVVNTSKLLEMPVQYRDTFSAAAAGAIAQNVYLYCASAGLSTVLRGWINHRLLADALSLNEDELPILSQTVGLPVDIDGRDDPGAAVLTDTAAAVTPEASIVRPRVPDAEVPVRRHDRYERIVRAARALPPLRTAIVHPCSAEAIRAAIEARDEGLLDPILIGPENKIRECAEVAGVSLAGVAIEAVEHSHAAAARAVEWAGTGRVAALMKGSLHTDELLAAVLAPESRLRTGRRISHVYVMDIPAYGRPLIVTDAAINIAPTLEQKRDICQNAIDLLHLLGVANPRVAVLAAVETVNPKMQTTLDAAALTVMATRGQIIGARVDGPLAFDNAISLTAAKVKGIESPVAGEADILLVPDLEAGNMLAKQLMYFADADAAGLVLGARVPIMLTSRSDNLRARLASAALAKLVVHRSSVQTTD